MLANFRTTGKLGFREDLLEEEQPQAKGWRHYYEGETISYAPHFQAYLWAAFLWACDKTVRSARVFGRHMEKLRRLSIPESSSAPARIAKA